MKRFCLLPGVLLLVVTIASAQETSTPAVEVGLNYSFVHVTTSDSHEVNTNGGSGYFVYNWNHVLGLVADFGGYHGGNANGAFGSQTTFSYLFGPRFNLRKSRFNPYVQFLFGGARVSESTALNETAVSSDRNVSLSPWVVE